MTVTDNSNAVSYADVKVTITGKVTTPSNPTTPPATTPPPATNPVAGNKPAVANAGSDQTVPADWNWFPTLNATLSKDPDGWIKAFQWFQVSGPNTVTLATPNAGQTKVTGWTSGTYTFRVAVTDNNNAISYDDVVITITGKVTTPSNPTTPSTPPPSTNPVAGNKPAVANAGSDQTVPADWNWFPTLNATLSKDPDGWIKAFQWFQVSGPNTVTLATPNAGQTKVTGWTSGTYTFRVAVTDDNYAVSYADVKITITK